MKQRYSFNEASTSGPITGIFISSLMLVFKLRQRNPTVWEHDL